MKNEVKNDAKSNLQNRDLKNEGAATKRSNPGYIFADWAGIDDDNHVYEPPILRKYNYNLETGTVGTNDDNIANILYNINRMEMKVSFTTSDVQVLQKSLGELYFMITDSKVHLNRFLNLFGNKLSVDFLNTVIAALDNALKIVDDAIYSACSKQPDTVKICSTFPKIYKNLLAIVPSVLALDNEAVGRKR